MPTEEINDPKIDLLASRDTIVNMKAPLSPSKDLSIPFPSTISMQGSNESPDLSESDNDDFVEFQLNTPRNSQLETVTIVNRELSAVKNSQEQGTGNDNQGVDSSALHENTSLTGRHSRNPSTDDSDDEDWKEMNTQLNYSDIYNIKGEKIEFAHSNETLTQQNKAERNQSTPNVSTSNLLNKFNLSFSNAKKSNVDGDGKQGSAADNKDRSDNAALGYTRIAAQEQATKFSEMDDKFDYLFQNENSNLRKLQNPGTNNDSQENITDPTAIEEPPAYQDKDEDDEEMNPTSQLASTKSMLSEPQKIAYAALVKLIIVNLHEELTAVRGSGSMSILKKLSVAQKSFTRWSMEVMDQLYDHLGVREGGEREMIEKLSCHGVEAKDLVTWLDVNLIIDNPLLNNNEEVKVIGIDTKNEKLEIDVRWTLICDLFLILLESSVYDSRSRTLLIRFANAIGIKNLEVYQFERRISDAIEMNESLAMMNNAQTWDEKDILTEHSKKFRRQKLIKIGFATVAGGLVIGLSAGVLAPVIGAGIAAGLTSIGVAGTSGFLAGTAGTAIITTTGTLTGMRIGNKGMSRRAGSVKTFEFKPLHNNSRVNLILTVSGWMSGKMDDIRLPFSTVDPVMGDLYSLLWEPEMLASMGQTIGILASEVLTQSIQQILGSTVLIALMSAVQLPMLLSKLGYLLDNPWNVSLDRAWSAGLVLADTLRRGKLGIRPITLVGFSLGARLIYSCLLDLAKSGDYGLIENVYLFGSPYVVKIDQISMAKSVVSGHFVNGYSKKDWILGYLYRATSGGLSTVAGLSPIEGIENFDCSDYVQGHMEYRKVMPKLLMEMEWEVLDEDFIEIEQPDPEQTERQRKLINDFEEASKNIDKSKKKKKKKTWYSKLWGKQNKEWWEMYEEGSKEQEEKHNKEKEKKLEDNKANDDESDDESSDASTLKSESEPDLFNLNQLQKEVLNIEKEAASYKEFKLKSPPQKNEETFQPEPQPQPQSVNLSHNEDQFAQDEDTTPTTPRTSTDEQPPQDRKLDDVQKKTMNHSPLANFTVVQSPTKKQQPENEMRSFRLGSTHHPSSSMIDNNNSKTDNNSSNDDGNASKETGEHEGGFTYRSTSFNFNVIQPLAAPVVPSGPVVQRPATQLVSAGVVIPKRRIANAAIVDDDDDEVDIYGDDLGGGEENIQIWFDDDFEDSVDVPAVSAVVDGKSDALSASAVADEKSVNALSASADVNNNDEEPFDYGDEDEFPTDERNLEITFS